MLMATDQHDLDALLITSPENVYYLIGLTHQGYFAFTMLVLPREGDPSLLTRKMEAYTISQQAPSIDHIGYEDDEDAGSAAVKALRGLGIADGRVGVDRSGMFLPAGVWEELEQGLPRVEWVDTSRSASTSARFRAGLVDEVRLIKSDAELEHIRRAAAISDRAVSAGIATAGVGVNEKEVAAAIYREMILGGGEYPGFVPLIRSSETLLQEHSTWRDRYLRPGEKIFMELSGASARYHAPLTRMSYIAHADPGAERAQALAKAFVDEMTARTGISIDVAPAVEDAVSAADVLVTATPSTEPVVMTSMLHPGLHVTAIGSDAESKQEIAADAVVAADGFFCDSIAQSARLGELRAALDGGFDRAAAIELGAVIAGDHRGRTDDGQLTICDLSGTGAQDTAIASLAVERCRQSCVGITIDT
jgi:Xaa-Pro aminopeptidase